MPVFGTKQVSEWMAKQKAEESQLEEENKKRFTREETRKLEDEVVAEVEKWSEPRKATYYTLLNAEGMTLEQAKSIRRKHRLII